MRRFSTVPLLLLLGIDIGRRAQIYVDRDATGANDGTSRTDAYTDLQTAIDNASSSSEIWIAPGRGRDVHTRGRWCDEVCPGPVPLPNGPQVCA